MSSATIRHPLVERLAAEIPERHLTQREAAAEIGVSVRTLQSWLSADGPTPWPSHRRAIVAWLEKEEVAA